MTGDSSARELMLKIVALSTAKVASVREMRLNVTALLLMRTGTFRCTLVSADFMWCASTRLARAAFADGADVVVPLDADEFLKLRSRAPLERELTALPASMCAVFHWQTYVPDAEPSSDGWPTLTLRLPFPTGGVIGPLSGT